MSHHLLLAVVILSAYFILIVDVEAGGPTKRKGKEVDIDESYERKRQHFDDEADGSYGGKRQHFDDEADGSYEGKNQQNDDADGSTEMQLGEPLCGEEVPFRVPENTLKHLRQVETRLRNLDPQNKKASNPAKTAKTIEWFKDDLKYAISMMDQYESEEPRFFSDPEASAIQQTLAEMQLFHDLN